MIIKNCEVCLHFVREEIGDSDNGPLYADVPTCSEQFDIDPATEKTVVDFDRDVPRDCCRLDFLRVDDPEIEALMPDLGAAYRLFKDKYCQEPK